MKREQTGRHVFWLGVFPPQGRSHTNLKEAYTDIDGVVLCFAVQRTIYDLISISQTDSFLVYFSFKDLPR